MLNIWTLMKYPIIIASNAAIIMSYHSKDDEAMPDLMTRSAVIEPSRTLLLGEPRKVDPYASDVTKSSPDPKEQYRVINHSNLRVKKEKEMDKWRGGR